MTDRFDEIVREMRNMRCPHSGPVAAAACEKCWAAKLREVYAEGFKAGAREEYLALKAYMGLRVGPDGKRFKDDG